MRAEGGYAAVGSRNLECRRLRQISEARAYLFAIPPAQIVTDLQHQTTHFLSAILHSFKLLSFFLDEEEDV